MDECQCQSAASQDRLDPEMFLADGCDFHTYSQCCSDYLPSAKQLDLVDLGVEIWSIQRVLICSGSTHRQRLYEEPLIRAHEHLYARCTTWDLKNMVRFIFIYGE